MQYRTARNFAARANTRSEHLSDLCFFMVNPLDATGVFGWQDPHASAGEGSFGTVHGDERAFLLRRAGLPTRPDQPVGRPSGSR